MADILEFPDKPIRDWRTFCDFHRPILLGQGRSEEATSYALARFKPLFEQLMLDTIDLSFAEECEPAIDALKKHTDRQGALLCHIALASFVEIFELDPDGTGNAA